MTIGCRSVRRQLGPFVDGELRGTEMLVVIEHLEGCRECEAEVRELRALGEALRVGSSLTMDPDLCGLAGNVASLNRARSNDTWLAQLTHACEDWHWPLVAGGSIAATCVSTVLVSVILSVGPGPERDDSLAGLIADLNAPPSPFFVYASSAKSGDEAMWLQLDNGRADAGEMALPLGWPSSAGVDRVQSQADVARELAETVTLHGRVRTLDSMRQADRSRVEALLARLTKVHDVRPATVSQTGSVYNVLLVATVGVLGTSDDLP